MIILDKKNFNCDKCGLCCRNIKNSAIKVDLDRGDGVCKNLSENNLCKIYYERPIFCNIDAYYEKFLQDLMTREKFHEINRQVCKKLKNIFTQAEI